MFLTYLIWSIFFLIFVKSRANKILIESFGQECMSHTSLHLQSFTYFVNLFIFYAARVMENIKVRQNVTILSCYTENFVFEIFQ